MRFQWRQRVYFHDTDAGGVVFHGNYLHFMEAARTEFLQSLGYGVNDLRASGEALFVVYSLKLNFLKPARLHDELLTSASLDEIGRARLHFDQQISRGGETLVSAKVHVACVDPISLKPKSLPPGLRQRALATPAAGDGR
jgi:acyl-CoA thioester hydrolase